MEERERARDQGLRIKTPEELEAIREEQERRRVYCPDGRKHPALMASTEPYRGVCPRCYADVPVLPRVVSPDEVGVPAEDA